MKKNICRLEIEAGTLRSCSQKSSIKMDNPGKEYIFVYLFL